MNRFTVILLLVLPFAALNAQNETKAENLTIIAVGDIMLGTNYPNASYLPPNDGKDVMAAVGSILEKGDLTVGNLEGVIHGPDAAEGKICSDPKYCYLFKSPDHYVDHFVSSGFDFLCVANNHINDFGSIGREHTLALLDEAGISYAGVTDHPTSILEVNGLSVGFAGFSPNRGTQSITDYDLVERTVQALSATCDVVVVSFHGGAEGEEHEHVLPGTETYLGENRGDPIRLARVAIDAGADVIWGHGPHVPRAVDLYKDRFIAYSLGNFATYARFSLKGSKSFVPILELEIRPDGSFVSAQIHSALQKDNGGPRPDAGAHAYQRIESLTRADRPDAGLRFPGNGIIEKE